MIKSIIFDMDGTLLDSSYAMLQSVNYVRSTLGLDPVSKEFLEYNINQPDKNLPKLFYNVDTYVPAHRELFKEHYLEHANTHVKPYEGAKELLEFLRLKNITMSIATNASDVFAINMLKHQGFLEFFEYIIGANLVSAPKPNPAMIDTIIENTKIPHSNTLLVGDSIKDELAAKNAGIEFLFASWGYGKSDTAKRRLDSLSSIKKAI